MLKNALFVEKKCKILPSSSGKSASISPFGTTYETMDYNFL